MRKDTMWRLPAVWLVILGFILMGCASGGGVLGPTSAQKTKSTEDLLSAAGFKQIFATTPHLKARLQAMPQKQVFMVSKGPKVFYVYADAAQGFIYAGNQQQYQAFQNLAAQYKMAEMQVAAAQMDEAAAWDWGEWGEAGPWGPWY